MHRPTLEAFDVSLVRDDVSFRLQRRLGLIPPGGLGTVRRAVFWSMLAWLPIAAWAWYTGRALPTGANEPLLAHFGVHVRFLVAVPLLIIAEGVGHAVSVRLLPHFVRSGLVPEAEMPRFRRALADIVKLRNAAIPWIAMLGVVLAVSAVSELVHHAHETDWAAELVGPERRLGFGGLWFLYVGRPIYFVLLLVSFWRAVLAFLLLRRIAQLDLAIVPTHPDRAGGLAFLEGLTIAFTPVVLALGSVLASRWAHDVAYHAVAVLSLRVEMLAFVIVAVLLFLSPLLVFGPTLQRARRRALLDYGALFARHGRLVHERWIEGKTLADDAVLNAPELGPIADTISAYDAVRSMRPVPIGLVAVIPLALAAAVPMIALLAVEVPITEILKTLLKALL